MPAPPDAPPERLAPLDGLRGLAALAVAVFAHFGHFGGDRARFPWATTTCGAWLYGNAWFLVDLFFLLSGMVLTVRYLEPIARGEVSARQFFVLRASRLYPLHLVTLGVCALLAWRAMYAQEPALIYDNNDLHHLFLNVAVLQVGWFDYGWSYNGPSWSIAIEACVYVIFFVLASARGGQRYVVYALLAVLLGLSIDRQRFGWPFFNTNVARGLIGFFLGSLIWLGIRAARRSGHARRLGYGCLGAFVAVAALAELLGYRAFVGITPLPHATVVFPLLVVACLEVPLLARALSSAPLRFLGDISYSVYMVHVPLQMVVLTVLRLRGGQVPTQRPGALLAYAVAVLLVATVSHWFLERPAQTWLRTRFREP